MPLFYQGKTGINLLIDKERGPWVIENEWMKTDNTKLQYRDILSG
jgi:hypothetical protein